jgi:CHAD domain-containing protein
MMGPVTIDPVSVYGAQVLLKHLKAMEAELEGVITGGDIEYVHRCRVASRRMRSALAMFETCFSKKDHQNLLKEMRKVTRSLGEARDTDVQIEVINAALKQFSDPHLSPGIRRLLLRLKQKRLGAQAEVIKAVEELAERDVLPTAREKLTPLAEQVGEVNLFSPVLFALGFDVIKGRLDELLAYEPFIYEPTNLMELHAMRISAKRLRYTLENFEALYGGQVKEVISTMRALQDALGAVHDLDVWIAWIPQFILEERERIQAYFGNVGQIRRLLPGLQAFLISRRMMRGKAYEDFMKLWKKITRDAVWDGLRKVISAPLIVSEPVFLDKSGTPPEQMG